MQQNHNAEILTTRSTVRIRQCHLGRFLYRREVSRFRVQTGSDKSRQEQVTARIAVCISLAKLVEIMLGSSQVWITGFLEPYRITKQQ